MPTGTGYAAALIAALTWGITFIPLKKTTAPGSLGIVYSMAAGIIAYLAIAASGLSPRAPAPQGFSGAGLLFLLLNGLTQFLLATLCYYTAVRQGEISLVAPLTRVKTVIVLVLLLLFRLETVGTFLVIACVAGLAGGAILARPPGTRLPAGGRGNGVAAATGAAFFWGVGEIFTGRALAFYSPLEVSLFSVSIGLACYLAYLALGGRLGALVHAVPPRDRRLYFSHGLLNYGIAYYFFFRAIDTLGVGRASVITAAWPLVSATIGLAAYRESVYRGKIIGGLLLLASVFLAMA